MVYDWTLILIWAELIISGLDARLTRNWLSVVDKQCTDCLVFISLLDAARAVRPCLKWQCLCANVYVRPVAEVSYLLRGRILHIELGALLPIVLLSLLFWIADSVSKTSSLSHSSSKAPQNHFTTNLPDRISVLTVQKSFPLLTQSLNYRQTNTCQFLSVNYCFSFISCLHFAGVNSYAF